MAKVQVYRLWPSGQWDLVDVEVEDEPWNAEIVETRAVTKEWLRLSGLSISFKPVRMGLFTCVEGDIAHTARVGEKENG